MDHFHTFTAADPYGRVFMGKDAAIMEAVDKGRDWTGCQDEHCLKYCPNDDCRVATGHDDIGFKCWNCGTQYVGADDCQWLAISAAVDDALTKIYAELAQH